MAGLCGIGHAVMRGLDLTELEREREHDISLRGQVHFDGGGVDAALGGGLRPYQGIGRFDPQKDELASGPRQALQETPLVVELLHALQLERIGACVLIAGSDGLAVNRADFTLPRERTDGLAAQYGDSKLQRRLAIARGFPDLGHGTPLTGAEHTSHIHGVLTQYSQLVGMLMSTSKLRSEQLATRSSKEPVHVVWPLLCVFANYKEAAGQEGSILSACLALRDESVGSLSVVRGELVMNFHRQSLFKRSIQGLPIPLKLQRLVQGALETPAQLRRIQRRMQADFDVQYLRRSISHARFKQLFLQRFEQLQAVQQAIYTALCEDVTLTFRASSSDGDLRRHTSTMHPSTLHSPRGPHSGRTPVRSLSAKCLSGTAEDFAGVAPTASHSSEGSGSSEQTSPKLNLRHVRELEVPSGPPGLSPPVGTSGPTHVPMVSAHPAVERERAKRLSPHLSPIWPHRAFEVGEVGVGQPCGLIVLPSSMGGSSSPSPTLSPQEHQVRSLVRGAAAFISLGEAAAAHLPAPPAELHARLLAVNPKELGAALVSLVDESTAAAGAAVKRVSSSCAISSMYGSDPGALEHSNLEPSAVKAARLAPNSESLDTADYLTGSQALPNVPATRESVIDLEEIHFKRRIGAGVAGTTYAARWNGVRVAVKVAGSTFASLEGWRAEVAMFAQLRHPNVVQYLGCVIAPPTFCLVLEYCEGGDVYRALRRSTPPGFFLNVARGAAAGMTYLHKKHIVHRDLKSANVLLDQTGRPKITDFGVSTLVKSIELQLQQGGSSSAGGAEGGEGSSSGPMELSTELLTAEMGTYRWMAPEVIRHEGYSKPADVFSYGMLLFELVTHEVPFANLPPLQAALAIGLQGLRPPLPPGLPMPVCEIIHRCWTEVPSARPRSDALLAQLQQMEEALKPVEMTWLNHPHGHPVYATAEAGVAKPAIMPKVPSPAQPVKLFADNTPGFGTKGMALSPLPEASPRVYHVPVEQASSANSAVGSAGAGSAPKSL